MPSILSRAWNAIKVGASMLARPVQTGQALAALFGFRSAPGVPGTWSANRTEQVFHFKEFLYIAINTEATFVSQHFPNIGIIRHAAAPQGPKGKQKKWLTAKQRNKSLAHIKPHEDMEPVPESHPLHQLLFHPNAYDTLMDLLYEVDLFLCLTGNAYLWVPPNNAGLPCEAWVIPSHWVHAVPGKDTLIEGYEIRPYEGGFQSSIIPASEIIHFKQKSPISKYDGYAATTAGATWADEAESISQARWFQFKNGVASDLGIELGADYDDPTSQDIKRIQSQFLNRYAGERRTGTPIIAPPGTKLVNLNVSAKEMAYVQSIEQMRDLILALFTQPKLVAGFTEELSRAATDGAKAAWCEFRINPRLRYFGLVLTEHLAKRFDEKLRIWWDSATPDDAAQVNADIQVDAACGAITPDEIRSLRGREPYPNGEGANPFIPSGLQPYEMNEDLPAVQLVMPGSENAPPPSPEPGKEPSKNGHVPVDRTAAAMAELARQMQTLAAKPIPAPVVNVTIPPQPRTGLEREIVARDARGLVQKVREVPFDL